MVSILRRMSAESRCLRFHHAKARLTRGELRYLTEIDYQDHFAWCAFIVDDSGTFAIGVARYIRVAPMSDHAEVAIEIVDQYQSRGVGTALIDLLAQTALEHGITSFIAYVEPVNASVIRWAQKAGGSFVRESGVLRVDVVAARGRLKATQRESGTGQVNVDKRRRGVLRDGNPAVSYEVKSPLLPRRP